MRAQGLWSEVLGRSGKSKGLFAEYALPPAGPQERRPTRELAVNVRNLQQEHEGQDGRRTRLLRCDILGEGSLQPALRMGNLGCWIRSRGLTGVHLGTTG